MKDGKMPHSRKENIIQLFIAAALLVLPLSGQAMPAPPGFDIWIASLEGAPELRNVTARPGYDNQPVFENESMLLFTRMVDGDQSDIARLHLDTGKIETVIETPESEYSPTPSPRNSISSVRVSLDGVQQLWELKRGEQRFSPVLPGVEAVGYHRWLDRNTVALFIVNEPSELHIANTESGTVIGRLATDIGRSLQVPPGSRNVLAFTEPGHDGQRWIKKLDLDSRRITPIAPLPGDGEDFVFAPDGRLVIADGKKIRSWQQGEWQLIAEFPEIPGNISRMAFSPSGELLAMVVAEGDE